MVTPLAAELARCGAYEFIAVQHFIPRAALCGLLYRNQSDTLVEHHPQLRSEICYCPHALSVW